MIGESRRAGATLRQSAGPRPDISLASRLFDELLLRTAGASGVTRASYGAGERLAHEMVRREATRLGLLVESDAALNLFMTLPGRVPGRRLIIGSHLDSVPSGGNFDGTAGVLAGLAVAAGLRQAGVAPPLDLTIMAIRAEESAWFNASYIGSRAAFGLLDAAELDRVTRSDDGLALAAHIAAEGGDVAALRRGTAFLKPEQVACFIEPHIEQGPSLVDRGLPIGIVTGIRGSFRHRQARCLGAYAHSGATPRRLRRDAVAATAELQVALDRLWRRLEAEGHDLAITIGQFSTEAGEHAFSKVAGRVDFSLDVRSQSEVTLALVRAELAALASQIEHSHQVRFEFGPLSGSQPALMAQPLIEAFDRAARELGTAAAAMPCGAGHDAAVFANLGIPTGMLFIRNANGSHNPDEAMTIEDFALACDILLHVCLVEPPVG